MKVTIETVVGGPLRTNCYVIVLNDEALAVDPGWKGAYRKVLQILKSNSASLKAIVLTHLHFDHVLGASELARITGAEVIVNKIEYNISLRLRGIKVWSVELFPSLELEPSLVSDGDVIKVGSVEFVVLEAPGHSPGSIVLIGPEFTMTGDVLFKNSIGRTDLPGSDPKAMEETLAKLSKIVPLSHKLYPGHGPPTTMSLELSTNPFLKRL
ncbi:MAG: MBL fold metallo-hydrolase [Acidilobaceae archaeon]